MKDQYRVGIIGATRRGDYGHAVDQAFTKISRVTIAAVADADPAGLQKAQQRLAAPRAYADYREMLAREALDIVAICPRWIDQHHAMLLAAAEAGCHVYMEKPFCRNLQECDEVVYQLQMRHLQLGIAHVSQYSPVLHRVKQLIDAGEIGDLLEIRGRGKEDHRGGGEDLWVLGSHLFGMMRTLAGGDPERCSATVLSQGQPIGPADVVDGAEGLGLIAGDCIQARYDFPGNVFGHFASHRRAAGNPSRFALQIFGSKGIIELESGYLVPAYVLKDSSWSPGRTNTGWRKITSAGIDQPEPRTDGSYQGGHIAAIEDLIQAIDTQGTTRCNAADCRGIIQMIAAVFASARARRTVTLPLQSRDNPLSQWAPAPGQ